MSNEYLKIKGKTKWINIVEPDSMETADGVKHFWKVTLYPIPQDLEKIRDLQARGLKNVLKKDEDGYYISFKRDVEKKIKGLVKKFDPPKVTNKEGDDLSKTMIGFGSDVEVTLEVYAHKTPGGGKAVAARLHEIVVDTLVPYEKQSKD